MRRSITIFALIASLAVSSVAAIDFRSQAANELGKDYVEKSNKAMLCAFANQENYKLFQFVDMNQYHYHQQTEDKKMTVAFTMCSTPNPDKSVKCSNIDLEAKNAFVNGYVYGQEDGKTMCYPIYRLDSALKNSFDVTITTDDASKKHNIKQVQMVAKSNEGSKAPFAMTTTINLICDPKAKGKPTPTFKFTSATDQSGPALVITMTTARACGLDMQKVIIFAKNYKVIPILFILVAIPLIFFGLKFIKASLATVGSITSLLAVAYVASNLFDFMAWKPPQWIIFSLVALVLTVLVGWVCYQSPNIAVMVGGVLLGYLGGVKLIQLYSTFAKVSPSGMAIGMSAGIFMVLGMILAWKIKNHAVILTTSFGGAQLLAFGIGTLIGNYPDFKVVAEQIKDGKTNIGAVNWAYIGGSFLIFIIGAVHQYKKYMKKANEEDENDNVFAKESMDMNDGYGNAGYY
jgi:hypothetical protein